MTMSDSPQDKSSLQAMNTARQTAEMGYGIGIPALQQQLNFVNEGMAQGGQPDYVKNAYALQRTGITEGLTGAERGAARGQAASSKGAVQGGNVGASMGGGVPASYGAKIAQNLLGSKTSQSMSGLEEMNSLMSVGLGGTAMGAGAAMNAGGAQLQAIGNMQNYNSDLANILGLLGVGGSIYGGFANRPQTGGGFSSGEGGGTAGTWI